ncbi:MAG: hypothetical protein ACREHD_24970 [Pirellulales bacterium]
MSEAFKAIVDGMVSSGMSRKDAYRALVLWRAGITADDLAGYTDFSERNQAIMQKIYGYYLSVFQENGDLLWAGMAKLAGNTVWNALAVNIQVDGIPVGPLAKNAPGSGPAQVQAFMERELLAMNLEIFLDLAWVHEAYLRGGIEELRSLVQSGELSQNVLDGFELIDRGIRQGSDDLIQQGNAMLLQREQQTILMRGYAELARLNLGKLMGALAKSPVPGGKPFSESVPGGDLANFADRWRWILKEMLPNWNNMDPELRQKLAEAPLGSTLDDLIAIIARYYLPGLLD